MTHQSTFFFCWACHQEHRRISSYFFHQQKDAFCVFLPMLDIVIPCSPEAECYLDAINTRLGVFGAGIRCATCIGCMPQLCSVCSKFCNDKGVVFAR